MGSQSKSWAKDGTWLAKFIVFAKRMCRLEGKRFNVLFCRSSTSLCRQFLTKVANERLGFTRPRSARTALSRERGKRKLPSLSLDFGVSKLVEAVEAAQPRTVIKSEGLDVAQVVRIADAWQNNVDWWLHQVTTMINVGFLCIFRLSELRRIRECGVRVVFKNGHEVNAPDVTLPVAPNTVKSILIHVPWRKNHQKSDCWVVLACSRTMDMMLQQLSFLRRGRDPLEYLRGRRFIFPSRSKRKRHGLRIPSPTNPVGHSQFVSALRYALRSVLGMSSRTAKLWKGHALRIGGSNYMRKLGISDEVHQKLGGWMSLASSQGYMQMSVEERSKVKAPMAV